MVRYKKFPKGNNAVLSQKPLCRGQTVCLLITVNYREAYGLYACNGILLIMNPLFVVKHCYPQDYAALAHIKLGLQDTLYLGNLDAKGPGPRPGLCRDAMADVATGCTDDFVIATGVQYSVRDFINAAAEELGMKIVWEGQGVEEKGYWVKPSSHQDNVKKLIVQVDPRYFRPTEVETLLGDPTKAKEKLGWTPKIGFKELVSEMVRADLLFAERDELIKKHGYTIYNRNE